MSRFIRFALRSTQFFVFLLLSACAPLARSEQPLVARSLPLSSASSLGQTFTARYAGLQGVALRLQPDQPGGGVLHYRLFVSPTDEAPLLTQGELPLAEVAGEDFQRLSFPALADSTGADYYLSLSVEGGGALLAGVAEAESYFQGSLYRDGQPEAAQLAFRLVYDPAQLALGLLREAGQWLLWLLAGTALFLLPGWALSAALGVRLSHPSRLGVAAALSLAIYPLLLLWAHTLALRLGVYTAWLPPLAAGLWLLWRGFSSRWAMRVQHSNRSSGAATGPAANNRQPATGLPPLRGARRDAVLLTAAVALLIVFSRFWAMRSLDAPLWGDSYQHSMIAQLILDHGGLFDSWRPYVPYETLTVQFGFPALAAVYSWLTGLDVLRAVLVSGQLLNALAALGVYPLAERLAGGRRWAGVIAVLLAGLLSPLPGGYLNWGRYAQLSGLAMLPGALWLLWELAERSAANPLRRFPWRLAALSAAALAGMTLAYYRMPFFVLFFFLPWLLFHRLDAPNAEAGSANLTHSRKAAISEFMQKRSAYLSGRLKMLFGFLAAGGAAILLFLPWAPRLQGSQLASFVEAGVTVGADWAYYLGDLNAWRDILQHTPAWLLFLSAAAFLWSILRGERLAWLPAAWALLLTLFIAGQLIHLPGANMLQNFTVMISLYLPIALLLGWAGGALIAAVEHVRPRLGGWLAIAAILPAALWGANVQRGLADPNRFALLSRPDLRAMQWIAANTPQQAIFLVEGFPIYGDTSVVGSDGGWWISLLSRRTNTLPPQYALLTEAPAPEGYTQDIVALIVQLARQVDLDSLEGMLVMCRYGVTHVYIGQSQGLTGAGAAQLFSPREAERQPALSAVYRQDRVRIYALDRSACPP